MISTYLVTLLAWIAPGDKCVLAHGRVLDAPVYAETIVVPLGTTVYVVDDVLLQAEASILVEGSIVGVARECGGPDRGHTIQLCAGALIDIPGTIEGGQGRSFAQDAEHAGEEGGLGAQILLEAPAVFVDGLVQAGAGGRSGPGVKGGKGGEVVVRGAFCTRRDDDVPTVVGGVGGPGGDGAELLRATDGGDGGDVLLLEAVIDDLAFWKPALDERTVASVQALFEGGAGGGGHGGPCQNGLEGARGGDSSGGTGSIGSNGANGSTTAPSGQPGGNGGTGGSATGANGTDGGNGGACCGDQGARRKRWWRRAWR